MNILSLDELYEKFGFSEETLLCLNYYGKEGSEKIDRIMERFRSKIKARFMDNEILSIEDYDKGEIFDVREGKPSSLNFPKSNVLCYNLVSGNKICVRPSGTEPKIKFYIMIRETEGDLSSKKKAARIKTEQVLNFIKSEAELS